MIRCYITDRRSLPHGTLLDAIARNLAQGVTWIQIREKDLPARDLYELTRAALQLPNPHATKILVNTRVDVALAAGAHGAHLPAGSPEPSAFAPLKPPGFVIGVSCHSVEEVSAAEAGGAGYAIFAPVFAPLSKPPDLPARGRDELARAAACVRIPVIALGGITEANAASCIAAGAAGIAGITLFQGRV